MSRHTEKYEERLPQILIVGINKYMELADGREVSVSDFLRASDYNVTWVRSGERALRKIHGICPDVVILDMEICGELDRSAVSRQIKRNARFHHVQIIFGAERRKGAKPRSASDVHEGDDHVVDPSSLAELVVRIESALRRKQSGEELEKLATHDGLTGLAERSEIFLEELLAQERVLWESRKIPASVVMFDIDHFKEVNDIYLHKAGDMVLLQIANILRRESRDTHTLIRWGGEEFLVHLPSTYEVSAQWYAERVREAVEKHFFDIGNGQSIRLTTSGGVAEREEHELSSPKLFEHRADEALYEAKRLGRNRVVAASSLLTSEQR